MKKVTRNNRTFVQELGKQKCFLCDLPSSDVINEDPNFAIMLDAFPAVPGHVICAPKKHVTSLSGLSVLQSKKLMVLVRKLDAVLRNISHPFRIAIVSSGLAVEHLHFHVVPIPDEEMMWDFKYLRKDNTLEYSKREKNELIAKIRKGIND